MVPADPPLQLLPDPRALIAGSRHDGRAGEHQHVYAGNGTSTTTVPLAGEDAIDAAVGSARTAAERWRGMPAAGRRAVLLRVAELIGADTERLTGLQTLESGMPIQYAKAVPGAAADFFAYYAGWSDKLGGDVIDTWPMRALDYAVDEPYGVVAIIVPWNAPLASLAQIAGAALAAGNAVVLKPPELAPFTSLRVGELFLEAGGPEGALNIVPGGPRAGAALVRHPGVAKVHFTGSAATARSVIAGAAENLTPVALELGGKSAHVIFADADVKAAARHAMAGLVIYSGQGCANGTRVLVQASIYDELLDTVLSRLGRLPVGDPLASGTVIGPVVSARACDRIVELIDRARELGAGTLVAGGERIGGELAGGFYIAPTVFSEVDSETELAQQEIFGPVLAFTRFETERDAIELANGTSYGLAAYVHTADVRRAHRVARALEAGNVWVNGFFGIPPSMPFGGTKQSGYGRVGGLAGLREFVRCKNVWLAL
ncbi:MAG: aldehyde dehydrogenase family protein [Solirubrobacteraceae bacterium]